jgi:hypothetical protein
MIIATFKARNRKARIAADGNVPEPFEQYTKERERDSKRKPNASESDMNNPRENLANIR